MTLGKAFPLIRSPIIWKAETVVPVLPTLQGACEKQIKYLKTFYTLCDSIQEILIKPLSHFTCFGCEYGHFFFFIFLISHFNKTSTAHIIRKYSSLFLIPHLQIVPKAGRVKIESSVCSWHCLLEGAGVLAEFWSTGPLLSVSSCLAPCWCPCGSRSPYPQPFMQFSILRFLFSHAEPLFLQSASPECLGPEAFPGLTISCAKITLSLCTSIGPRTHSGS